MEDKELEECLRELFAAVNEEARLAGGATLERCMDTVLNGPGLGWLLDTAQAWKLADADEVRQHAAAFRDALSTEAGKAELRRHVAQRRGEVEKWRRQIVAHIRAWQAGKNAMDFRCQGSVDAKGIYGMLAQSSRKEGDTEHGASVHDNQG